MNAGSCEPPKRLEFRFKGDRDYIHGTDIFNALVGVHPPADVRNVHFTIHGLVRTPRCELYQADSREAVSVLQGIKVHASFDLLGVTQWLALRESSASGSVRRYEYAEDRVTALCDVRDHLVVLNRHSPFTFIETVVAMNKHLHLTEFSDAVGKWLFTCIDLKRGCDAREGISLQIGRDVNYRLTRAEIVLYGQVIGNICFSLVKR
jgi:hypothetical protein